MLTGTRDEIQERAVDAMVAARNRGLPSALVEAFTGFGKTKLTTDYIKRGIEGWNARVLFLVHMRRLVEQAEARFTDWGVPCAVEMADRSALGNNLFGEVPVIIGSRDTMQDVQGRSRLTRWPPNYFTDIFVDEAHLGRSARYDNILGHFKGHFLVGLSATPFRMDGQLLVPDLFAEKVFRYTLPEGIRNGHAVELREVVCQLNIDLKGLKAKRRSDGSVDFSEGELAARIGGQVVDIANAVVAEADRARAVKVIAFMPSVDTSIALAQALRDIGAPAVAVHGNTQRHPMPEDQLKARFAAFESGGARCLVSCNLVSLGYDYPPADMAVLARPTKSLGLFMQQVGRVVRVAPGKAHATVVGFAWEADDSDGIVSTTDLFLEDADDHTRRLARKLASAAKGPVNPRKVAEKAQEIREKELERERQEVERRERKLKIKASRRELNYERWERNPLGVARSYGIEQVADSRGSSDPVTPGQASVLRDYGFTDVSGINAATAENLIQKFMDDTFMKKVSHAQVERLVTMGYDRTLARTFTGEEAHRLLGRQFSVWRHQKKREA